MKLAKLRHHPQPRASQLAAECVSVFDRLRRFPEGRLRDTYLQAWFHTYFGWQSRQELRHGGDWRIMLVVPGLRCELEWKWQGSGFRITEVGGIRRNVLFGESSKHQQVLVDKLRELQRDSRP